MSALVQRKLEHARRRMDEGDVAGTVSLCEEVLAQAPRNPEALWLLGMARLASGDAQAALGPLEQAVATAPSHGMLLDGVGLAYLMLGRYDEAERALRKAASAPGAPVVVHMRRGMALTNLGRHTEAAKELQHVLASEPDNLDARVNLGLTHARSGDVESAAREFQQVLARSPRHAYAMYNMGVLSLDGGDAAQAESWFRAAVGVAAEYTDARINLGVSLQRQGRLAEAVEELRIAAAENPPQVAALNALGQALGEYGRPAEAREIYARMLATDTTSAVALEGLALAESTLGRHAEAAAHLRELVRVEPQNTGAWKALAGACFQSGVLDEAIRAADRALQLDPAQPEPYITLAMVHYTHGMLDKAVDVLQQGYGRSTARPLLGMLTHLLHRMCDWPRWRTAWTDMASELADAPDLGSPYWLIFEDTTPHQQLDYTRRWAAQRFSRVADQPLTLLRKPGRIRLGYLSADFQEHPVARQIVQVLELHDRSRFEVFAYSHGVDGGSAIRERIRNAVEHFVDIAREPNDRAVALAKSHDLDLMVDLRGYTMGDRLEIMAERPAPVQITWLGFPGGVAAEFIDYIVADPFVIPVELESAYRERVLRMPHSFMPNDRKRAVAPPLTRAEYGLPERGFVFVSFNQTVKITPEVFASWMNLLRRVEGSVLWLLHDNAWATANLHTAARDHGIAPDRVIVAPRLPTEQHLARYHVADVALDTFPYGSHTTACDVLWGGCPLVPLCGSTFAARVSGSIVTSCGLSDLVADNINDAEALAYRLATDESYMRDVRSRLEQARDTGMLFDTARFTRDLEALYTSVC